LGFFFIFMYLFLAVRNRLNTPHFSFVYNLFFCFVNIDKRNSREREARQEKERMNGWKKKGRKWYKSLGSFMPAAV